MPETPTPPPIDPALVAAERAAPVNTRGPLPRRLSTLQYEPEEWRNNYERDMQGMFVLAYLNTDDTASVDAYLEDIANGALPVYARGDSPTKVAERQAANERLQVEVLRLVNESEQQQRNAQIARERAALEEQHAREMAQ